MNTENPFKLIDLLEQLLAETDKINIGKKYIAVVEETNSIRFVDAHSELVYKHLIRLSIKDYIHSGHSEASIKVIKDVMNVIATAVIVAA